MPKKQTSILDAFKRCEKNVEPSTSFASTRNRNSEKHCDGAVNDGGQQNSTVPGPRPEFPSFPVSTDSVAGGNTKQTSGCSSYDTNAEEDTSFQGSRKRKRNNRATHAKKSRQCPDGSERRSVGGNVQNAALGRAELCSADSAGKRKRHTSIVENLDDSAEGEKSYRSSGSGENAEDDAAAGKKESRNNENDGLSLFKHHSKDSAENGTHRVPLDSPLARYFFMCVKYWVLQTKFLLYSVSDALSLNPRSTKNRIAKVTTSTRMVLIAEMSAAKCETPF